MDFRAANEQQQEARWRVFLMFIVMALLIIRSGLVSRERRGQLTFFRIKAEPLQGWRWRKESKLSPSTDPSPSPADIQQATLVLLCLAEAAGQLIIVNTRAVWELMNQPLPRPARERTVNGASLCEHSARRLDTS